MLPYTVSMTILLPAQRRAPIVVVSWFRGVQRVLLSDDDAVVIRPDDDAAPCPPAWADTDFSVDEDQGVILLLSESVSKTYIRPAQWRAPAASAAARGRAADGQRPRLDSAFAPPAI